MGFSERFLWGVSLCGFQFEMGSPEGKDLDANTDWYMWVHDSTNMKNGSVSGDLPENGVDYWNRYKKDHTFAKNLGINAFRIGTEWSRIFPENTYRVEVGIERAADGNIAKIELDDSDLEKLDKIADKEALNHYRTMIEDLRAQDLKVFVCLHHFTTPLWLHDPITARDTNLRKGPRGWVDEGTAVEFTKYAAYMAWKLGDIVDHWATFNEPTMVIGNYSQSKFAGPPSVSSIEASEKVRLHLVIAHARAYDALRKWDTVKADEDTLSPADVGLIHATILVKPLDSKKELDIKAAESSNQRYNNRLLRSITSGWLDQNSSGTKAREEVKSYMAKRLDWLGVNYYSRIVVKSETSTSGIPIDGSKETAVIVPGYGILCKPNSTSIDGLPTSDCGWEMYPDGMLEALRQMKDYGKPLYVTENGIADEKDRLRSRFLIEHLKRLDTAINEENIDVRGYFHWSLMDNYEWARGFNLKFGLCAVDLKTKERMPRKSATTYKKIIEDREVKCKIEKVSKCS